jgi:hypothetical protein
LMKLKQGMVKIVNYHKKVNHIELIIQIKIKVHYKDKLQNIYQM